MTDVRRDIIASLKVSQSNFGISMGRLEAALTAVRDAKQGISDDINALQSDITILSNDIAAYPVPASAPAPVVTTPTPSFGTIPLTEIEWADSFNARAQTGAILQLNGASVVFQPSPVPSSKAASSINGTNTPGTASMLLLAKRFLGAPIKDFRLKLFANTVKQLRTYGAPNPWECFWIFFNHHMGADGAPAYNYLALKPNGLEVGTGFSVVGQKYWGTSSTVKFPINTPYSLDFQKIGRAMNLSVNGVQVWKDLNVAIAFDDAGTIGLYSEDANVVVSELSVSAS